MKRSRVAQLMLLVMLPFLAAAAFPQIQDCAAARDSPPPQETGIYTRSGDRWISMSNPTFYTEGCKWWQVLAGCGFVSGGGFRFASISDSEQYLKLADSKAKNRTSSTGLQFLVRGHARWTAATFIHIVSTGWDRSVPINGDKLAQNRIEASVRLIQKDLACVQPNSQLGLGEYVLALYPSGSLPSKRENFFDFGID